MVLRDRIGGWGGDGEEVEWRDSGGEAALRLKAEGVRGGCAQVVLRWQLMRSQKQQTPNKCL